MTVTFWMLIGRGARKHCPVCNQGRLFRRWFTMIDRCPRCSLGFHRIDGHWSGDLGLNIIVSFTSLFVVVLGTTLATWPDGNTPLLVMLATATTVLVPIVYYPFSKTMWLAIDLAMRPLEPGEVDDAYGVDRGNAPR